MGNDTRPLVEKHIIEIIPGPRGDKGAPGAQGSVKRLGAIMVLVSAMFAGVTAMTAVSLSVQNSIRDEYRRTTAQECKVRQEQVDSVIERDRSLMKSDQELIKNLASPANKPVIEDRIATYDKEINQLQELRRNCG